MAPKSAVKISVFGASVRPGKSCDSRLGLPAPDRQRPSGKTPEAARRHSPIPVRPLNAGCDSGPLIVGAGEGDASGAGIRLPTDACGVGGAKRVVARA